VIYFSLRALAIPSVYLIFTTLALIWLYILITGGPPSAIRAGWSPRSCSPQGSSDAWSSPCDSQTYNGLTVRFSATVGEEPEVGVGQV
jgi:hypothetical protein